jgi:dTDP-4-amino-4,6-dideoxygalactose transaminase
MSDRIPLSEPNLAGNALRYLQECVQTNYVSSVGPFVDRFEREFAACVGTKHAVACASGTAAIHVALRVLGVGRGDEVFVSTLTFIASANPILYEGATPVLVDAEEESWNLDPVLILEEISRRAKAGQRQPKAVEAVHILGHPARLAELAQTCERHGIALIEDAAEALGARYLGGGLAGRHVGTVGQIGCYSFNGNKIITSGGGGMIGTDDEGVARRAKHLTTQARVPGVEYVHDEVGYNYRLTNLAAALGVAQLEQLPAFVRRKREIAARYDAALGTLPGITLPPRLSWAEPTCWLYSVRIDAERFGCDWRGVRRRLAESDIDTRPIWNPLHSMTVYQNAPRLGGAVAERLFSQGLSLPCSTGLTSEQQARVIDLFQKCHRG